MGSSQNERVRARARLESEAPISDDVDVPRLQQEVSAYIEKSSHETVSFAWEAVARDFFGHVARKNRREKKSVNR